MSTSDVWAQAKLERLRLRQAEVVEKRRARRRLYYQRRHVREQKFRDRVVVHHFPTREEQASIRVERQVLPSVYVPLAGTIAMSMLGGNVIRG